MNRKFANLRGTVRNVAFTLGGLALTGLAMADTDPFTTAIADSTTKVSTYGAALVVLAAVGVGFMIAIKYVKKIVKAA